MLMFMTMKAAKPRPPAAERTMAAGVFKAKCLRLIDEVAAGRGAIIVTKRGRPVAKVVPLERGAGAMRGTVLREDDMLSPIDVEWDAAR